MQLDLITIKNAIILEDSIDLAEQKVIKRLEELNIDNIVATEETMKAVKKLGTELKKECEEFEAQRIAFEKEYFKEYNKVKDKYKEKIVNRYKEATAKLKETLTIVQKRIIDRKTEVAKSFFEEMIEANGINWLTFDRLELVISYSDSQTETKIKKEIRKFVEETATHLRQISSMEESEEFKNEVLLEFKRTLDFGKSVTNALTRRSELRKIEQEKQADVNSTTEPIQEVKKEEPLSAPKVEEPAPAPSPEPKKDLGYDPEEVRVLSFKVQGKMKDLKLLVDFIRNSNLTHLKDE